MDHEFNNLDEGFMNIKIMHLDILKDMGVKKKNAMIWYIFPIWP